MPLAHGSYVVKTSYKMALTLATVPILLPLLFFGYNTVVSGYLEQGPGHIGKALQVFLAIALLSYVITALTVLPVFFVLQSRGVSSLKTLPLWAAFVAVLLMVAYALLRPGGAPDMLIMLAVVIVTFNATVFCTVLRWRVSDVAA
jgi:hypothetical protein